ncbi:MAG: hypothetical protein ACYDB7_10895 [Mycobacteriales bacterium]
MAVSAATELAVEAKDWLRVLGPDRAGQGYTHDAVLNSLRTSMQPGCRQVATMLALG